jgi:hypothetical protein
MRYPKRSQYKCAESRHRVRNWADYEAGLRKRGALTVWLVSWLTGSTIRARSTRLRRGKETDSGCGSGPPAEPLSASSPVARLS